MKKLRSTVVYILLAVMSTIVYTPRAEANPFSKVAHYLKDHPTVAAEVTGITFAAIHAKALHDCRIGDVERCDENYGEAWAWYGVITTWSVGVGPALMHKCLNDQDNWKGCYFFGYSGPVYQGIQAGLDWKNYKPKDQPDTCHDMRCEERRFRRF